MWNDNVSYLFIENIFKLWLLNLTKSDYIFGSKLETYFHFIYGILIIC